MLPINTIDHRNAEAENKQKNNRNNFEESVDSSGHQGTAAWVTWLKDIRISKLLDEMRAIDLRKENALNELKELTRSVEALIESNRGGDKGIHGFIGERAQVYIKNAWALIKDSVKVSVLIDDNGMTDYLENGIEYQQKACRAGGKLGLDHVLKHKQTYPFYPGRYQIPKDFYAKFAWLSKLSPEQAGRLRHEDLTIWKEIQKVLKAGVKIESMTCTYDEIQRDRIFDTIRQQETEISHEADRQVQDAKTKNSPTLKEGLKTTAASAAVEGSLSGAAEILKKHREGKRIRDYTSEDAKDVGKATLKGTCKGAVRGAVVYSAANYTKIPAPAAGAAVTVAFDGAKAVKQYADGKITGTECASEVAKSAIVASAGALGAKIGRKLIPVPVLGEVVGSFVFSFAASHGCKWVQRFVVNRQRLASCPCYA